MKMFGELLGLIFFMCVGEAPPAPPLSHLEGIHLLFPDQLRPLILVNAEMRPRCAVSPYLQLTGSTALTQTILVQVTA
jgi:hypothetical protein